MRVATICSLQFCCHTSAVVNLTNYVALSNCQAVPGLLWTPAGACVCQENPRAQDCLRACSIKVRCSFSCSFVWTMRNMSAKSSCCMSLRPASAEFTASEQTLNATVTSAIMVLHRHRRYWHTDACKQQTAAEMHFTYLY